MLQTHLKIRKSKSYFSNNKRGCLKIELRWPLLFYFKLKSFGFFSKKEAYKLTFSIQTVFYWYKPPKRLFLQDYVQWPAGRTQFQPS